MSDAGWLAIALGAVFTGIGGYAASIIVRTRKLEAALQELRRRRHPSP